MSLTLFFPMFPFDPVGNIRKLKIFWCFQEDQKGTLGRKSLTKSFSKKCKQQEQQAKLWSHKNRLQNFLLILRKCNSLQPGVAFQYPLKTSENLKVFWCFQGYRKATPGCNGLIELINCCYLINIRKPNIFLGFFNNFSGNKS